MKLPPRNHNCYVVSSHAEFLLATTIRRQEQAKGYTRSAKNCGYVGSKRIYLILARDYARSARKNYRKYLIAKNIIKENDNGTS